MTILHARLLSPTHCRSSLKPQVTAELQPVTRLHARNSARLSVAAGYELVARHRRAAGPSSRRREFCHCDGTPLYLEQVFQQG